MSTPQGSVRSADGHRAKKSSSDISSEDLYAEGLARYDRSDEVLAYVRDRRRGDLRAYDPYRYRRPVYRSSRASRVLTLLVAFVAFAAVGLTVSWVLR